MAVNPKNAHVRKSGKRQSPEVQADDAQRLLNDPAFERGFSAVREGMINEIINLKHDGSDELRAFEAECCRVLRTLESLKRAIAIGPQVNMLRLADFQPVDQEKANG